MSLNLGGAAITTPADVLGGSLTIRNFDPEISERWDQFVQSQPTGSLFHLSGWKRVIEKTFSFRPQYYCVEREGQITGVAPLFLVENWVIGRCFHSVPFGVYGGICAADEESRAKLLSHIKQVAIQEQVDYLELHERKTELFPEFHLNSLYSTFTTTLSADHDANLKKLPRDTRYMIRKGEKAGLHVQHGSGQLDDFYSLVCLSLHRLGTPVFAKALFRNLIEEFGANTHLMLVYSGSQPVSGVLSFYFRDAVLPYYAGANASAPALAANNFMYWELMKDAVQKGFHTFDFGRSKKNTGAYAFKSQWSMTVEPLKYQVYLVRRKTVPNFSPVNPKFEMATKFWRKLPLGLTTRVGPRLVRWFP